MKKLLLSGAALIAMAAAPAQAEGLSLDVAGHFKGYAVYNDQDEPAGTSYRSLDFRKETEVHFTGETTLDNGLTVGAHIELDVDRASNGTSVVEESYAYFSGGWGRINFGEEDGAAYLLQVAAPSADANVDGIRQYITSFNPAVSSGLTDALDYDMAFTGYTNKFTYMTPVFNGFQAGFSYVPAISEADQAGTAPITVDNTAGYDDGWELAARYEGAFEGVGVSFGGGYGAYDREVQGAGQDDRRTWNAGLDLDWNMFGLGVAYMDDNNGLDDADTDTMVIGADYQMGAYKLGLSYYDREDEAGANGVAVDVDTTRWTGGVTYSYGPGMSFRGSLSYVEQDGTGVENEGYEALVGTQINF